MLYHFIIKGETSDSEGTVYWRLTALAYLVSMGTFSTVIEALDSTLQLDRIIKRAKKLKSNIPTKDAYSDFLSLLILALPILIVQTKSMFIFHFLKRLFNICIVMISIAVSSGI